MCWKWRLTVINGYCYFQRFSGFIFLSKSPNHMNNKPTWINLRKSGKQFIYLSCKKADAISSFFSKLPRYNSFHTINIEGDILPGNFPMYLLACSNFCTNQVPFSDHIYSTTENLITWNRSERAKPIPLLIYGFC